MQCCDITTNDITIILLLQQIKHYRAKPSAQLSKHLQDDIKYAVMKLELK